MLWVALACMQWSLRCIAFSVQVHPDDSRAAVGSQEQGSGEEQSSGKEQSTDSKQAEQESGRINLAQIQGWDEAENSIVEGVWVVDLTQDKLALNQGEDTYMVRLPAFRKHRAITCA